MRVRATVLLVRHQAVLLVRQHGGPWLLPGGPVGMNELALVAAVRALHEDTGVEASAAAFLFQQVSAHHLHHVFRVAIPDDMHPRAAMGGGIDDVLWVAPAQLVQVAMTPGTRAILSRATGIGVDPAEALHGHDDPGARIDRRRR